MSTRRLDFCVRREKPATQKGYKVPKDMGEVPIPK